MRVLRRRLAVVASALAPAAALVAALGGCQPRVEAPTTPGVCYALEAAGKGAVKFNVLAQNQPDIEHCGAQLDMMRLR
ncbi:MAG: hypothetical protein KGL69_01665, partial [Alphaproteobacteria bacterium]|nr:hypothetical protein [Alphaproteobacteria bacterium]